MSHQVLLITSKEGLNSNLLRLAAGKSGAEIQLREPSQVSAQLIQKSQWIIVDDRIATTPAEAMGLLGEAGRDKSVIYLHGEGVRPSSKKDFPSWTFLPKPFHPDKLHSIMAS
jgi:hypothetical protein